MYKTVITGNVYKDYLAWRKGPGYVLWRKRQWAKQNGLCYYCSVSLKNRRTNVEHVIPMSRGGTNKAKNLLLPCGPCNKEKGNRKPTKDERLGASKMVRRGY